MTGRRNRLLIAIWLLALAATAGAVALVLTSNHESNRVFTAVFAPLIGVAFVASGLIAWARRPDNRFGALMVLVGFTWFVGALTEANASAVFTLGALLSALPLAAFAHAVLAYPSGRLESRFARTVVVVAYIDVTIGTLLAMLFETKLDDTDPHAPPNALLLDADHTLAKTFEGVVEAVGFVATIALVAILFTRWRRASGPLRRALGPVLALAGLAYAALAVELAVTPVSKSAGTVFGWIALAGLVGVPIAFLAGLLRTRLARAAVGRLVVELGAASDPVALRDSLRRALRDPTLELAFWLPTQGAFVDHGGQPVELPPDDGPRVATLVEHEERRVGALVHDRSVCEDPQLLQSVAAAAALALENARLQTELRARFHELERERDFSNAVVRTTPSMVVVLEPDGTLVEFNEACEQLTGYSFEEVRGKRFWDLFVDPQERPAIASALAAVRPGTVSRNENHWITRSGERRLIVWSNAALGDDGRVAYIVSGGIDVTDYRRQQAELKASRARIVEAGMAERRRLERNLHDGAQQRLVALSLALRLAKARLRESAEEAESLLDAASEELAQALEELRELARGIHPAVLTDRGLDAALEALTARAPLPIDLEAELDERLPPPVEAAAYYVVAEGLTNVVKYAHASEARVSVSRRNGTAIVEVVDDGVGGADPGGGSGLAGLRDRIEALDGRLDIRSEHGRGTLLRAEIPCAS